MENIRDWNISRQLLWGQQIPAYYYGDKNENVVVLHQIYALPVSKIRMAMFRRQKNAS